MFNLIENFKQEHFFLTTTKKTIKLEKTQETNKNFLQRCKEVNTCRPCWV